MQRKSLRFAGVVLLGITAASLLVGAIGISQVGIVGSRAAVANYLDKNHLIGPRSCWWRAARRLDRSNPAQDARHAIKTGETRLIGSLTLGPPLPGLDPKDCASYKSRYGVRFLIPDCQARFEPESEFEPLAEIVLYQEACSRYASTYNRVLVAAVSR
jgi:hypothetical protein